MLLLVAVLALQATPTFVDILKSMHADYRKLQGFRESWSLKTEAGDTGVVMTRAIDGDRFATQATQKGTPLVGQGYDGTNWWVIVYANKIYDTGARRNSERTDPFTEPKLEGDPGVSFTMSGGYDFNIAVSPKPEVKKVEDGRLGSVLIRKVSAVVNVPNRPKPATLEMWFDRDAWILRRIEARWKGQDGKDHFMVGAGTIERGVRFKQTEFVFDPGQVVGFTRQAIPGMGGG